MLGLEGLSSDQLLAQLLDLVHRGRKLEADLIAHLAEVDARRLYLREGCSSMFAYCVGILHFAEAVAYKRIAAMRAARRHPELLTALRHGDLHLTAVSLLAPQLTAENLTELLAAARNRTADEIRRMLADRQPKPDVASAARRLSGSPVHSASSARCLSSTPCVSDSLSALSIDCASSFSCVSSSRALESVDRITSKGGVPESPPENASVAPSSPIAKPTMPSDAVSPACKSCGVHPRPPEPLGNERYLIRFTADRELYAQIRELKSLMRHQIPNGDVGKIFSKAVAVLLKQVRARKFGECSAPRPERTTWTTRIGRASPSRHIPTAIRRAVSKRDGERCTFVSATGRRCDSRDFLEFHHCEPWAKRQSHAIDGITLRCRAHNQYEAERDFGTKHMQRFRGRGQLQAAHLLTQISAVSLGAEASRVHPSPAAALQPELDLNPVGVK
jgi:hypothetical protein